MILHVDGDAFFASCEIAQNERFRGKPVVAGADRGIALAVSYVAKDLGISRGMTVREIRENFPQVIITQSHYGIYRIYSLRMFQIVRRYAPIVEEYSVDECFADLSQAKSDPTGAISDPIEYTASLIKRDLERDLGMTFSIGVAPTKVLAKVASKWNKPSGFTIITPEKIPEFLSKIPAGKIWGIGPSSSANLMKYGVKTAGELAEKPEWWILEHLSKPYVEIWHELNGRSVMRVREGSHAKYKSVMKTATFRPITKDPKSLLAELARNTERACAKLRRHNLAAQEVSFYLKSQEFRYYSTEFKLPVATNLPTEILNLIEKNLHRVYSKRDFRATGVILRNICPADSFQQDLFGKTTDVHGLSTLYKTIDHINHSQKKRTIFLARSLMSKKHSVRKIHERSRDARFPLLNIPYWGEST